MEKRLRQLLDGEDKRNPYTDQELADKLSVRREEVTLLRNKLGIPDSRERRREQLTADAEEILRKEPGITARALTDRLRALGYDVSRYVAAQLLKELAAKTDEPKRSIHSEFDAFAHLIGWDGSLRTQIQQAKAAVIYPPNGLHTLILGESGTGKSELAEAMYRYSLESGQRPGSAPFVVFNCADYAENPQLLISQLFGHVRGAYTGANEDKAGLVEKANGGFLFLDEVHRLPPEGQEILYSIIDKGCYRRLGESGNWREVNLMLIAATTENPESALLAPFRRRIPMVIELPPLRSRPLTERLEIILHFFRLEAARLRKKLVVRRDVLRALLSGDKPGNVGQIKSDIQVACARGYLNHFGSHSAEEIEVTLNELSPSSRRGLLDSNFRQQMVELLPEDIIFYPGNGKQRAQMLIDDFYSVPDEIYTRIEGLIEEGRRRGMSADETNLWVSQQIEQELSNIVKRIESKKAAITQADLEAIVGPEIIAVVSEMVDIACSEIDIDDEQLFYYLAIHLNTAIERLRSGKSIVNPQLGREKKDHEKFYLIAVKMAAVVKRKLELSLPEEEIGFLSLYLRTFLASNQTDESKVAVLVLSHGRIAQEMVKVANSLLKTDHANYLDMALTESPEDFFQRVLEKARQIDQGKGILLLVDMGSLVTFGEMITRNTGIKVRVFNRVDLVMVLEATRWSMLAGSTLDEIAQGLIASKITFPRAEMVQQRQGMIIAVCLTGVGNAEVIKARLERIFPDAGIKIQTIGIADENRFRLKLEEWQKKYHILAIVGTINPEITGIPFVPYHDIVTDSGTNYLRSLVVNNSLGSTNIENVISKEQILLKAPWRDKKTIIKNLGQILLARRFVKPGYIDSVFEREELAPTCIPGGIAIPHGSPEYVIKPGIALATLAHPIDWWGMEVDVVVLLALRISDRKLFSKFLNILQNKEKMRLLREAENLQQARAVIFP